MTTSLCDIVRRGVLVVDRDPTVQGTFRWAAQGLELPLRFAPNAEEAWAELETEPPWLVVSDYVLFGLDGLSLLQEIGRRYPGVKRILHTSERIHRTSGGVDIPVLDRPCPPDVLRDLLQALIPPHHLSL